MLNQNVGDLLRTIERSELSQVRTEVLQLLIIPSLAPHPKQPHRQLSCHSHFGDGFVAAHRQMRDFAIWRTLGRMNRVWVLGLALSISISCAAQTTNATEAQEITVRLVDCRSGTPYAD